MRIRSISYWMNTITAEKENHTKGTREPTNSKDLLNYQIAEYIVNKSKKTKVA